MTPLRRALLGLAGVSLLAAACADAQESSVSHGSGTMIPATMKRSHTKPPTPGTPISIFADPTITQTSAASTNPPTWDSVMPDLQDGDSIQLDFSSDGSTPDGNAEESHTVITTDESIIWSTFNGFAGGATVKWRERYGRTLSGSPLWSNWSNTLSDVMASAAAPPAGYVMWQDVADLSKLFQSNAGTTAVAADGDVVGYWGDKSANGRNLTSVANDTTRPTFKIVSGKRTIRGDGSNDFLRWLGDMGTYAAGAATEGFALKCTSPAAASALSSFGNTANTNSVYNLAMANSGTAANATARITTSTGTSLFANSNNLGSSAFNGVSKSYIIIDSGSTLSLYIDNVLTAQSPLSYTRSGTLSHNIFALFGYARSTPASFMTCDVSAHVLYNSALNSTDRTTLDTYLQTVKP